MRDYYEVMKVLIKVMREVIRDYRIQLIQRATTSLIF